LGKTKWSLPFLLPFPLSPRACLIQLLEFEKWLMKENALTKCAVVQQKVKALTAAIIAATRRTRTWWKFGATADTRDAPDNRDAHQRSEFPNSRCAVITNAIYR
jgi:hypothetical protein